MTPVGSMRFPCGYVVREVLVDATYGPAAPADTVEREMEAD